LIQPLILLAHSEARDAVQLELTEGMKARQAAEARGVLGEVEESLKR
jgi:hypothetical protein